MFRFCQGCSVDILAGGFCAPCRQTLLNLKRQQHPEALTSTMEFEEAEHEAMATLTGSSLFLYQGIMRRVIMRAKVRNDLLALNGLVELFVSQPKVISLAKNCDVLVPAPSSLWGRMRGRFDLAQSMALGLGAAIDLPVSLMPWVAYMRFRKRAGSNRRGTEKLRREIPSKLLFKGSRVLVIDDVMTTGNTMRSTLMLALNLGAEKASGIALASGQHLGG
ncbi:MAG: phosphoribosyltransferase family protein [Proteobacteria bacterium]|nr:phosphoribosyltransferase family protein [Pseudomonadota bacterium]